MDDNPFHCYNPLDLQSWRFACTHPGETAGTGARPLANRLRWPVDAGAATRNMLAAEYVGVVEAYHESICLFHAKIRRSLPDHCDCTDARRWGSFRTAGVDHGVDHHSIGGYSDSVLRDIDVLTRADNILYLAARARFVRDIRDVEREYGTKILCNDKDSW